MPSPLLLWFLGLHFLRGGLLASVAIINGLHSLLVTIECEPVAEPGHHIVHVFLVVLVKLFATTTTDNESVLLCVVLKSLLKVGLLF